MLAVYASALTICLVAASLRWELAIPLPDADEDGVNILVLAFMSLVAVSLLVGTVVATNGARLAEIFGISDFVGYMWVLPVGVAAGGAYQVLNYWAIRCEDYGTIGKTKFAQNAGEAITQVVAGLFGFGPSGLLGGDVFGRFGGTGGLVRALLKRDSALFQEVSYERMKMLASRYRHFPMVSTGASLLNSAGAQLPPLLVASAYGSAQAGFFMIAFRVVAAPTALVGRGVSQVYMGKAAQMVGSDPMAIRDLMGRVCTTMAILAIPPAVVLAWAGVPIFSMVFGEEWANSGSFVRAMSLVLVAQMVVRPVSQTLNILERQPLQLLWDAARLVAVVGSILVPALLNATAVVAVVSYAIVTSVMYIVLLVVAYWSVGSATESVGY